MFFVCLLCEKCRRIIPRVTEDEIGYRCYFQSVFENEKLCLLVISDGTDRLRDVAFF